MRQRNAKHSLLCVTSALWSNADATTTPMQEQLPLSVIVTAENCCATAERSSCKGTGKNIFNNISIMEPWQKSVGAGMNHSKIVIPLTNRNERERPRRALPFSSKSCSRDRRQSQVVFISAGVTEQEFRGRTRRLLFVYLLSELPSVIPFFPPHSPSALTFCNVPDQSSQCYNGGFQWKSTWLNALFRKWATGSLTSGLLPSS